MDLLSLIPAFGGFLQTVLAFVLALSIIVAVHEYGHYIVGRWCGIHAEVFSLGFGKRLASRVDSRGTRWQIAALPFGGYVKFLGDADAASGKDGAAMEGLSAEERRHTMHGAPLWARSATVAAGPLFNFAMSILVFAAFFLLGGVSLDRPVVGQIKALPGGPGALAQGDTVLALNGVETPDLAAFYEVADKLSPAETVRYRIERDGSETDVDGPFPFPPLVIGLSAQSAAIDAGLQAGDVVTAVDGEPIHAFSELREKVAASEGKPVSLTIWRDGEILDKTLSATRRDLPNAEGGFDTRWLIGLTGGLAFENSTRTPGVFEAFTMGVEQVIFLIKTSISGLYHMITGAISTCNLSGPLGIAGASGDMASQGAGSFLRFVAVLSTAVGLLNLFPIPVLDGGHLVFHAYEAVMRRPPNETAVRVMMTAGLALILTLMVFSLGNDLFCP